jgi:uncharacterized protein (TIGR03545 family)
LLIAFIFILGLLFSDTWIENRIEESATTLNGARVDIDNLELSLSGFFIKWDKLQVTDPGNTMKNRFETGACQFDLEFLPLLSKKVIIESFTVTDIRVDTDRTEDGAIDETEKRKVSSFLKKTSQQLVDEVSSVVSPQISSLKKSANVDSIMKILDLKSISKIKHLQNDIDTVYQSWEKKIGGLNLEEEFEKVESQIKSIDPNKIKTADQYFATAQKVEDIYKTINESSKIFKELEKNFKNDLKDITDRVDQVDNWIEEDYKSALSKAKIPQVNAENISKLLFGDRVANQLTSYIDYIATARALTKKSSSDKPNKESPPRLKGQDVYFYNPNARPDFWIKKLNISGQTKDKITLSGLASDIVSDQRQIGQNTQITLEGKNDQGANILLKGVFDYLTDEAKESFDFQYSGISLADYRISNAKLLPNKIERGTGTLYSQLNITEDQVEGEISFTGRDLKFDMSVADGDLNEIEKIIQSIIRDISMVNFAANVRGNTDKLVFSIKSNLDDILMNQIGSIVNQRFKSAREEITKRIDGEIKKYRTDLDELVRNNNQRLQSELNKFEQMLTKEKNMAEEKEKEIEEIYKKEKLKIEDKIKDFFKP